MANNFTMQDVQGILLVLAFFSLIFIAPGYLLAHASNVFGFRQKGWSERTLLSLVLSGAVSPYLINILCRFFPVGKVSLVFVLLGLVFLAALLSEWRQSNYALRARMHWSTKAALGMVFIWIAVCLASLPDLQIGQALYSTTAAFDHAVRTAFISSALRSGAPPSSPFFFVGSPIAARYYYYWNVLCAVPAYLSGANTRVVLYASCIWSGLLLAAIIPVYLKHFLEKRSNLRIASVIGIALIAITGLDLLPALAIQMFAHKAPFPDMEWWNPCQITSWLDSLLWVPHHVASLIACLAGYLSLWKAVREEKRITQLWLIVFAALGFSSAAGLSVYVMLTFGFFVLAWTVYLLCRGSFLAAAIHATAGACALLLSMGFLRDLLGPGTSGSNTSSHFLAFAPRQLPLGVKALAIQLGMDNTFANVAIWVLAAAIVLFLELGIYMLVGLIQADSDWRQWRALPEAQKALWFMAGSAFAIIMRVRSTVIGSNDLGFRGALVLQFVLLLWASIYLADWFSARRAPDARGLADRKFPTAAIITLIAIGGASSLYQLCMLRAYTPLSERYGWTDNLELARGHDAFMVRSAYQELDRIVPASAIVQFNPESALRNQMQIYSRYQEVDASSPDCMTAFGGLLSRCATVEADLQTIFNPASGALPAKAEVSQTCQRLHIDVLVVNALDPVWKREDSWVWRERPLVQNGFVRAFWCGEGR